MESVVPSPVVIGNDLSHVAQPDHGKRSFQSFFPGFRLAFIMHFLVLQKTYIANRGVGGVTAKSGLQRFRMNMDISGDKDPVLLCHFLAVFSGAQSLVDKRQFTFCKRVKLFLNARGFGGAVRR